MARGKEEPKRVEVGFSGGQAILLRLEEKAHEELQKAVKDRGGWYQVDSLDGIVSLDLGQVVFVKSDVGDHRVGFSGL